MKTAETVLREVKEIHPNNPLKGFSIPVEYALRAMEAYHAQFTTVSEASSLTDEEKEKFIDDILNELSIHAPDRFEYGYFEDKDNEGHINNSGFEDSMGEAEFEVDIRNYLTHRSSVKKCIDKLCTQVNEIFSQRKAPYIDRDKAIEAIESKCHALNLGNASVTKINATKIFDALISSGTFREHEPLTFEKWVNRVYSLDDNNILEIGSGSFDVLKLKYEGYLTAFKQK